MSGKTRKPIETIDIIEGGKLKCDVYFHDILVKDGVVCPAWTFVTRGLFELGNKEMILTLKCQSNEVAECFKTNGRNFPEAILHLFANIFDDNFNIEDREHLDEAMWYEWPVMEGDKVDHFLRAGWTAFLFGPPDYLAYSDLDGLFIGKRPYLSIQPIFEEEYTLVKRFGALRIMALLGQAHHHYPWPYWTDRDRSSVIPPNSSIEKLVNNKIFDAGEQVLLSDLSATFDIEKKSVALRIPQAQVMLIKNHLDTLALDSGFIFNLTFAQEADSHLYWSPDGSNNSYRAITRPSHEGQEARKIKTLGGSFLAFVPRGTSDFITIHEDGFVAMISPLSWMTLRQCMANGLDCKIASDSEQGLELDISFVEDDLSEENEDSNQEEHQEEEHQE